MYSSFNSIIQLYGKIGSRVFVCGALDG